MSDENKCNNLIQTSDNKIRTILFALMNSSENIDFCQIFANNLQKIGFKVVFAIDKTSSQMMDKTYAFDEEVYDCQSLTHLSQNVTELDLNCLNGTAIDKLKNFNLRIVSDKFDFVRRCEDFNEKLLERIRPELIIIESLICSPILTNSDIPWVWLNFGPPNLYKNDKRMPPPWSGISIRNKNQFIAFRKEWNQVFKDLKNRISNWCQSRGAPDLPENIFHPHSPYLNFYVYPTVLEYKLGNTWELKDWYHFDSFISEQREAKMFVIPESLQSKHDKLIYLSMGPFASVELMKRLIQLLSESKNKFIVSKGPLHNRYELADNMWGLEDIPLKDVIKRVDLVITCGDTKTIFECLFNAKPLIILPLFGDQLDNRTRIRELGFGWGLDPFNCQKETLLCMIESTLDDKPMFRRLNSIADSIKRVNPIKQMLIEIENLLNRLNTESI